LAQLIDVMSGRAKSGFPGRKVRKLSREASLGGHDDAHGAAPSDTADTNGDRATEVASVAPANPEVDSSSDSEPE